MLDGGMRAWTAAGAPITTEGAVPKAASFKSAERRDVLATAEDVRRAIDQKDTVILDTRSDSEHFGTVVRAARGGAIPRSIHVEWTDNLDTDGKFKLNDDLKAMYDKAGITSDKEVYSYCQAAIAPPTLSSPCGCWVIRKCATTSAPGKNGAIERPTDRRFREEVTGPPRRHEAHEVQETL
jgi:rhodanese-related sulfurtransferase